MKCTPVANENGRYPQAARSRTLPSLVIGATITVSMALLSCASSSPKEATPPTLPPGEHKSTEAHNAPPKETDTTSTVVVKNKDLPKEPIRMLGGAPPPRAHRDSDGDGVPDNIDKCPTVKGLPKYQGCPPPRPMPGRIARPHPPRATP